MILILVIVYNVWIKVYYELIVSKRFTRDWAVIKSIDNCPVSILLKSRLIGFSGVFWFYSGASLVMALYAYLVKTTSISIFVWPFKYLLKINISLINVMCTIFHLTCRVLWLNIWVIFLHGVLTDNMGNRLFNISIRFNLRNKVRNLIYFIW